MGANMLFGYKTKRQQAAALQTLHAYQRPLHRQQHVRNHRDQRALPCDGVTGHISQPGVAEGPEGARAGGVARQATLVPATPGCEICEPNMEMNCQSNDPVFTVSQWKLSGCAYSHSSRGCLTRWWAAAG